MYLLIFQWSIISLLLILLVHYLYSFFQTTLTIPKIKDLVNRPANAYKEMYETINHINTNTPNNDNINNSSNNSNSKYNTNNQINVSDNTKKSNSQSMKDELKNFLSNISNNSGDINDINNNVNNNGMNNMNDTRLFNDTNVISSFEYSNNFNSYSSY